MAKAGGMQILHKDGTVEKSYSETRHNYNGDRRKLTLGVFEIFKGFETT